MFPFELLFELEDFLPEVDGQVGIALGCAMLWAILWAVYSAVGHWQQRDTGGTLWRLVLVSAILATAALFPAALVHVFGTTDEQALLHVEFLVFMNALLLLRYQVRYRPPRQSKAVPVESPEVLEAADRLARQMKISRPTLLQFPADGTGAWAFSLVQPTVVVMEGLLHRLEPVERDAILAHEFAHFANATLWLHAAVIVAAASVAAVAASLAPGLPIALGLLVFVGLHRMTARWLEIDCDRRAARVVGYAAVMSGLAKIHALRGIANRGWPALLFDAVASHPSRDVRLDELRRAAPPEDRAAPVGDIGLLRYHRAASWVATGVWIAALVVGWRNAQQHPIVVAVSWSLIAACPWMLHRIVGAPLRRRHARRLGRRYQLARALPLLLIVGLLGTSYAFTWMPEFTFSLAAGVMSYHWALTIVPLCLAWVLLLSLPKDKVRNAIRQAVNSREFQQAVDLAHKHPRQVKRDPISRHNIALAHLGLGHHKFAQDEFTELWETKRFGFSGMWLAVIHLNEGRADEALRVADELARVWTKDPAPPFLRGRALRRMGRLDEAEAAIVDAIGRFEHARGDLLALRAGIVLDRGDLDQAREFLRQAEQASPGAAYCLVIAADIAQKGDDPVAAADAVAKALQALRRILLPMFQFELEQLESTKSTSAREVSHPDAIEITEFIRQE